MSESPDADHFFYNDTQNVILSTIPHFVGPFSLAGSALIIYVILHDRRHVVRENSYDRIMLGLSTCDVFSSFGFAFFGPWAVPEKVEFVVGARAAGFGACEVAGCLVTFTFGTVLYTAGLMIYFILLVRLQWRPETIAKRVEPWIHAAVVVFLSVVLVVALVNDYMNPLQIFPGVCWFQDYPPDCDLTSDIPCFRGEGTTQFAKKLAVLPFLSFLIVLVAMVLLTLQVWRVEQRLAHYQVDGEQAPSYHRTRKTGRRGLAYVGAFVVSFLPLASFALVSIENRQPTRTARFRASLAVLLFFPLQGFFNAFIYIYPKWNELTKSGGSLERLARGLRMCRRVALPWSSLPQQQQPSLTRASNVGAAPPPPNNINNNENPHDGKITTAATHTATVNQENKNEQEQQFHNEGNAVSPSDSTIDGTDLVDTSADQKDVSPAR